MYHKYVLSTYEKLASGDPIGYKVHKCVGVAFNDQEIIEVFFMRTSFPVVQVDPSLPDMPLARDIFKKY